MTIEDVPLRRRYPSLLQWLGGTISRRLYAIVSTVERWHAVQPWTTRLLLPLTILYCWWHFMSDPNAALMVPARTLSPAACNALLATRETGEDTAAPDRPAPVSAAPSLAEAMLSAAGDQKRLLLTESNSGYGVLAQNWVRHVQTLKPALPNYLVVSLDRSEANRLTAADANTYFDTAG
jgi:hypothetical protein